MKKVLIGLALVTLFGSQVAVAATGEETFKKNCAACHGTGVGPSAAEIAKAYAGDKAALKTFLATPGTAPKVAAFASKASTMQSQMGLVKSKITVPGHLDAVVDYLIAAK